MNAFFIPLHPAGERSHPLLGDDGIGYPLPGRLDVVKVHLHAYQGVLHLGEEEEVGKGQFKAVGWVAESLDDLSGEEIKNRASSVNGGVVLVEEPAVVGNQVGSLQAEGFQELLQGVNDEFPIDFSPMIHNVGVLTNL